MDITWMDKHHRELTTTELYALLALRCAVFVVEQQCAYLDVDGDDLQGDNRHLLGMHDNQLVAYARLLAPADAASPVKIGRVIVSDSVRGARLGKRLMAEALASCQQHWPGRVCFSPRRHICRRSMASTVLYRSVRLTLKMAFHTLICRKPPRQVKKGEASASPFGLSQASSAGHQHICAGPVRAGSTDKARFHSEFPPCCAGTDAYPPAG